VSLDNLSLDFKAKRFVDGAALPLPERHTRWMGSFGAEQRASVLAPDVRAALAGDDVTGEPPPAGLSALDQVLYLDMTQYLEGDILVKTDRASMMASLEARVPLLNADVVEYVTGLPLRMKLRGLRSKYPCAKPCAACSPRPSCAGGRRGSGCRWATGSRARCASQFSMPCRPPG
jgi:asparagine synthase (glutamine-hydrolysing)